MLNQDDVLCYSSNITIYHVWEIFSVNSPRIIDYTGLDLILQVQKASSPAPLIRRRKLRNHALFASFIGILPKMRLYFCISSQIALLYFYDFADFYLKTLAPEHNLLYYICN